jgi:hypothetical protein
MSDKDVKDFASTKHKGLPEKVKENLITKFDKFINEELTDNIISDEEINVAFEKRGLSSDKEKSSKNGNNFLILMV